MMIETWATRQKLQRSPRSATPGGLGCCLILAVGCSSPLHGSGNKDAGSYAAGAGGNPSSSTQTGAGGVGATGGNMGSAGSSGAGGAVDTGGRGLSGGSSGAGGLASSGGAVRTGGSGGAGGVGGIGGRGGTMGMGGNAGNGGLSGFGGAPRTGGVSGTGGTTGGQGGAVGSGGKANSGGVTGSGGGARTGGVSGSGDAAVSGGSVGAGGNPGSGGAAGSSGGSGVFGMPCTTDQDCPPEATCCDGSNAGCDGTRLPSGDGGNPGEFVVSADGLTVTDTITGLVWQLDDRGPRPGCTGTASSRCTWEEARAYCASLLLGGLSGWRLPGAMEALTLLDPAGVANPNAFPASVGADWTSASSQNHGLYLDTGYGGNLLSCGDNPEMVRCARGARCYPKSRFVVLDGGLVRDALTGLIWQERSGPTAMTWTDGQSYCSSLGSSFRLPTVRESLALLGLSSGPTTPFPGGVPGPFWTSTPDESPPDDPSSAYARYADYFKGFPAGPNTCEWGHGYSYPVSTTLAVRCVR